MLKTRNLDDKPAVTTTLPQYTLRQILMVWAMAALPMGALAWVVAPRLADSFEGASALPRALILTLTAGMVWQFVLVMILVHREQGSLRWSVLKDALWLHAPRSPKTGLQSRKLWLLVLPLVVGTAAALMMPLPPSPTERDLGPFLDSTAGHEFFAGNWAWYAICILMFAANTVFGEELLFRGLLLPRMQGVFGRGDWVANGVLFAAYHLHVPWVIPNSLCDTFLLAGPAKRYRSTLLSIAVHSAQSVFFAIILFVLVLG